ncbi:DNA adenine methylase [Methylomonas rivi]|uniref:site-specific DNA-methyltransferase (adenine-specific) n=1 Tax=Methylomonas rivi TaxID=2952226 RepID=A0ABT1U808_9GAMM|nr:DNA adenine methylase [Methylomonas sp. WSC-6]MCQ8129648.1 DNA adenine methylase [Methylomonas sp. WSC-6]
MTFDYLPSESINGASDWSIQNSRAFSDAEIELAISKFPKTRYYGSKRRLLSWIYHAVKDLPFDTVLDGFGGTASVSLLFKAMGKKVYYHDALLSNTISAHALLADEFPFSDINDAYQFIESIKPENGFIAETFANMYYTDEENRWLDGAAKAIHAIENPLQRSAYFYCLFQACLKKRPFNLFHRANLNLRLNKDVKRSFGNFSTWERSFVDLMKQHLCELSKIIINRNNITTVLPPSDVSELTSKFDLIYIDPPYIPSSKTTDDYLKKYHFLEGLSEYNNWKEKLDQESIIKSHTSIKCIKEWNEKSRFKERLFDLINTHKSAVVVLSYLENSYPQADEITDYFKCNFSRTKVIKKDFCHALAKENKTELIFIGSNKWMNF